MSLTSPAFDLSGLRDYAHDWALVDVETSGLVPRRDRVLSVAVVTLGPDGRQTGEFSTLLNPGCDPGPVHVHGLTAERLRGAPTFDQVADRIGALLADRVLVAHNAQFDYDFLAHEFSRARTWLPVTRRLCTLALNRRVDPPTDDLKLGTLAAHYGVPQVKAHDALDDTRVLAGVLRASLQQAARLGLPLPLVTCPPRQDPQFAPQPPKTPCGYRNPGRLTLGGPLVQGMKVAVTGETRTARAELVGRSVAAGLNMVGSVSRHTSALVTNDPASGTAKARRALAEGVPVIDETAFLRLLDDVRPGTPHEQARSAAPAVPSVPPATLPAVPAPRPPEPAESTTVRASSVPAPAVGSEPVAVDPEAQPQARSRKLSGPLSGRRVLVLGGTHPEAVAARTQVVELGGAAAINLSASVTDVVLLDGGEADRRMSRITSLAFPTHDAAWLDAPVATTQPRSGGRGDAAHVLPRGGVVDLPSLNRAGVPDRWTVSASWGQRTADEIDLVAFVVDEDEQVCFDEDFVFYGAPENPAGTVRLLSDGPTEQTISIDLVTLPPATRKVVVAAAIDGTGTFGDVGAVHISSGPGTSAAPLVQATLDAATTERTLLLAEIYRRGPRWRLRAVGQGYDHGLAALAGRYGVDVAD
ncbi:DNA polymerase-3 subunit epsilon [Streptomyces sp. SAI-135]|uniref:DEDDh family exonuclease n=1 Tax=unclassified Streptomyces TaxID=2593676 RepID=UPI0024758043|nr:MULTISPECIES: DEDDh family exonuclease [unclassified Streptomyces]MDH6514780.1 DNA polymerase-3 subunit epsilon [Streptomyces sp. SAI-090]MDH6546961.1 DNA polymerase-3 subunit epsilon [Streptomyces sp. SAI-041]MDH6621138.1 DNA polymerase-3 subunit epsilon [Streptomyces sp. SAI-135]